MVKAAFRKGAKMERWQEAVRNPERALNGIGAMMVAESEEAFDEQAFGEAAWEPRAVPNIFGVLQDLEDEGVPKPRRFEATPALIDSTLLSSTITFETGKNYVSVGSNLEYAWRMFKGGPVESVLITEDLQGRLRDWLKGPGKTWRSDFERILQPDLLGQRLEMEVPPRPFLGVTKQTIADVESILGVEVFEITGTTR